MSIRPSNSLPSTKSRLAELAKWGSAGLASTSSTPRLDAELLLAFAVEKPRSAILAFPEALVESDAADDYRDLIRRRSDGVPLAYLTGSKEFYSLALEVTSSTLVPRPETELLVDLALARSSELEQTRFLDLGTGCGAIALAIKHARPNSVVTAVDSSRHALDVAQRNAERLSLDLRLIQSDWFESLGVETYDVIVTNPPYVAREDIDSSPELAHEPGLALDGGPDGLDEVRSILSAAGSRLVPGGCLIMEHGHDQGGTILDLAAASGYATIETVTDLAGLDRALVAQAAAGS
ncbi:MAG: peptide chain release factor N(5)-glutamine methyltransferase [Gammaproteobacteria bacterium]